MAFKFGFNNPIVIVSSIEFFISFEKRNIAYSKVINYVAKSVLAVLLIHSSKSLNYPMKDYFRFILGEYSGLVLVLTWLLGIIGIFLISVTVDQLRIYTYQKICPWLVEKTELLLNRLKNR